MMRKRWVLSIGVFICLLIVELVLSITIPKTILTDFPSLRVAVSGVQDIVPSTSRFSIVSRSPEAVDFYLAFSALLLPFKMVLAALILRDSGQAAYSQFVVSPLTLNSVSLRDYVAGSNQRGRKQSIEIVTSLANRLATSLIVMIFCVFIVLMHLYIAGWDIYLSVTADQTLRSANRSIAAGGWSMWLSWSVWKSTLTALAGGIILCMLFDYVKFFAEILGTRRESAKRKSSE